MGKFLYGTHPNPLPDIHSVYTPEKQAKFPYVCISWNTDNEGTEAAYRLCFYDKEGYVTTAWWTELGVPQGTSYEGYFLENADSDTWKRADRWSGGPTTIQSSVIHPIAGAGWSFVWSNTALYNEDGSLAYSGGPDPIPVSQLNYAALMQGFFVGQAIRRNR